MLDSVTGKCLSMLGTSGICESTSSTVIFMKTKCKLRMSDKNPASKLRCALSVKAHFEDFEDFG